MSAKKLLALWGLKWNPFTPEVPSDALLVTAKIDSFVWRAEQLVQEGGFALICGDAGTGKSVALRIVAQRLAGALSRSIGGRIAPHEILIDAPPLDICLTQGVLGAGPAGPGLRLRGTG